MSEELSPKKQIEIQSGLFNDWTNYTPENLEAIAKDMRENGIFSTIIYAGNDGLECREIREETDKEYERRLKKEAKEESQRLKIEASIQKRELKELDRLKKKYERSK